MATQYTAGITQGQAWTAAIANQIGAVWETWTPTVTSSSGTITSSTVNVARYARIQQIIYAYVDVTVTNNGTGSGALYFTCPINGRAQYFTGGVWREIARTGTTGVMSVLSTGTQFEMRQYNNAYPIGANNDRVNGLIIYEAA